MIADAGITIWSLSEIVAELKRGNTLLQGAAGAHLMELVSLTATVSSTNALAATP